MGSEAKCRAQLGERAGTGTALLETDEIIFRGEFRAKVSLREVTRVEVDSAWLRPSAPSTLALELGPRAAAWAKKIAAPPSLLDKLGVTPSSRVAVVGAFEEAFLAELSVRAADAGATVASSDLVLLRADASKALARLAAMRKKIRATAAVWVVFPKGRPHPREADVISNA